MPHDDQRNWLAPQGNDLAAISTLALRVVSVLNERQVMQQFAVRPHIGSLLGRRILNRSGFNAADVLAELRGFRLRDEAIIETYIPAAARSMGALWSNDDLGFAEVTVATARLQNLLTEIAYVDQAGFSLRTDPPRFLIVMGPDEQHTLGGFVLAAQLRRKGCVVEIICCESWNFVDRSIRQGGFDGVLFSCSSAGALETIGALVQETKMARGPAPFFALGGIVSQHLGNIPVETNVDIVTSDVDTLMTYLEEITHMDQVQAV